MRVEDNNMANNNSGDVPDDKSEDSSQEERSVKQLLYQFMDSVTMHGFGKIANAPNKIAAALWAIILFSFSAYLIMAIHRLHLKLIEHNVKVVEKTMTDNTLHFPAVTVCRMGSQQLSKVSSKGKNMSEDTLYKNINHQMEDLDKKNLHSLYKTQFGQQTDRMLLVDKNGKMPFCVYGGEYCSMTNFKVLSTIKKGHCYTFNHKGNVLQILGGSAAGLFLTLYVEDKSDTGVAATHLQSASGIEVFIHDPEMKNPTHLSGLTAALGTMTRIKLTETVHRRLPHPYPDKCEKLRDKNVDGNICHVHCLAEAQVRRCNVVSSTLATFLIDRNETRWLDYIANADNSSQVDCIKAVIKSYTEKEVPCICPLPCHEREFGKTTSHSTWPPESSIPSIVSQINRTFGYNLTADNIRRNLAAVQVFHGDLSYLDIRHLPAYDLDDFSYDLGGLLGLLVGASAFSAIELCIFVLYFVKTFIKKLTSKNKLTSAGSVRKINVVSPERP